MYIVHAVNCDVTDYSNEIGICYSVLYLLPSSTYVGLYVSMKFILRHNYLLPAQNFCVQMKYIYFENNAILTF